MEQPSLPFEHSSSALAVEYLAKLGIPQLPEATITSFAMHYIAKGVADHEALFHVVANTKHGGGLQMLLSTVAAENTFVNNIPDELVRMSLFRLSEDEIGQQKLLNAGIKLGISKFLNPQHMAHHAGHVIEDLTQFQEKLVQRVSPTDPGMRK